MSLALAVAAHLLTARVPIGSVALAIVLGALVGNVFKPGRRFQPGISLSEKTILAWAIVLMGLKLDFWILQGLGFNTLLFIVLAVAMTIGLALALGRVFRVNTKLALLLGIGSGICGSSAIAAANGIIKSEKQQVGLSVAVVNSLGTLGIFLMPVLGHQILELDPLHSGVLVGNTLQAVGQVVAAGFSLGDEAGQTATLVKMARILMLTPVMLVLLLVYSPSKTSQKTGSLRKKVIIPWFVVGFALMTMVPTFHLLPSAVISGLAAASDWTLLIAMAAIGLNISVDGILRDGRSALLLGALVFVGQILFSTGWLIWIQ